MEKKIRIPLTSIPPMNTFVAELNEIDQDEVLMGTVRYLKEIEGFQGDELEFFKAIVNVMSDRLIILEDSVEFYESSLSRPCKKE